MRRWDLRRLVSAFDNVFMLVQEDIEEFKKYLKENLSKKAFDTAPNLLDFV